MTKKSRVVFFIILPILLVIVILPFFNPLFLIGSAFRKIADKLGGTHSYTVTGNFGGSKVELTVRDKQTQVLLTPVDKSTWPKETIGGLYRLEPSGEFSAPISMKVTFDKDPGPFFSFGYWHADTKKWEWIPTVKNSDKVYETVLFHASEIGGAQRPSYEPQFRDPKNQTLANEVNAELAVLQNEMADGRDRGGSWEDVWQKAKKLTDKLTKNFCDALEGKSPLDFTKTNKNIIIHDLLAGMEFVGALEFNTLVTELKDALNSWLDPKIDFFKGKAKCKKPEEERSGYRINQTDNYETQINLNLGQGLYTANQQGKNIVVSYGAPISKAAIGWKTKWIVYQYNQGDYVMSQRLRMEGSSDTSYVLLDVGNRDTKTNTSDRTSFMFDLTGVKEGGSFPVIMKRAGAYTSKTSANSLIHGLMIIKNEDGTFRWQKTKSLGKTETIDGSPPRELTGVLTKDHGTGGAVIQFGKVSMFTPEQLKQFQALTQNAPAGLKGLYDAQGNPTFMSGDLEFKPLIITKEKTDDKKPATPKDDYGSLQNDREKSGLE